MARYTSLLAILVCLWVPQRYALLGCVRACHRPYPAYVFMVMVMTHGLALQ